MLHALYYKGFQNSELSAMFCANIFISLKVCWQVHSACRRHLPKNETVWKYKKSRHLWNPRETDLNWSNMWEKINSQMSNLGHKVTGYKNTPLIHCNSPGMQSKWVTAPLVESNTFLKNLGCKLQQPRQISCEWQWACTVDRTIASTCLKD